MYGEGYLVSIILLFIVHAHAYNPTFHEDDTSSFLAEGIRGPDDYDYRKSVELLSRRRRDEDYSDEGGFVSAPGHNKPGGDDFIANIQACPAGTTRAPWAKCISCAEYQRKLRRRGEGC
ncbi:unnamed protein product [Leptosia nina]|uniref:Secreted protein n=1 Tax=Leptosia nina TaxID=320188 RepID=A0AAV1J3T4_9NEOP